MGGNKKVYLVGLDGFNRGLFDYLEGRGVIPRLSGLVREGSWGVLHSTRPPYTGPAWVSMFTGVNPGRHGIYGFTRRRADSYGMEVINADAIGIPRIWDFLCAAKKTAGVFNVPFTFPVRQVKGFMVSGMLTPSVAAPCAWPEALADRLRERSPDYPFDLAIDPDLDSGRVDTPERILCELQTKYALLEELLDTYNPDFLMAVLVAPDRIQHLWGKALLPGGEGLSPRLEEEILKVFSGMDGVIGGLFDRLGSDDLFLAASDHGFTGLEKTFYLNNWLIREGYLALKGGGCGISGIMGYLNRPWLKRLVPDVWLNRFRGGFQHDLIDWERTKAYASPGMEEGIYLNLAGREPRGTVSSGSEADRLAEEIREGLLKIKPVVLKDILPRRDVYRGECLDQAPDLLLDFSSPGWNMSSSLTGKGLSRDYREKPFGVHHPDGFWVAHGKGVEPGMGGPARIVDIAPTIMNSLGLAPPEEMEGGILPGVLSEDSLERVSVPLPDALSGSRSVYASGQEEVKERLKGLGYL